MKVLAFVDAVISLKPSTQSGCDGQPHSASATQYRGSGSQFGSECCSGVAGSG